MAVHTAIDRRALITGRIINPDRVVTPPDGEITSIIVQARPENLDEVAASITALIVSESRASPTKINRGFRRKALRTPAAKLGK